MNLLVLMLMLMPADQLGAHLYKSCKCKHHLKPNTSSTMLDCTNLMCVQAQQPQLMTGAEPLRACDALPSAQRKRCSMF
jgi:hypothetical protein